MFKQKFTSKNFLAVLGLIGSLVWLAALSFPDSKFHLVFCDVGQGDATLITQGFNQILIDGGPNDKVLTCLKNNMPFFDKTIEIVAVTHPEADHMTGIIPVMEKYKVNYFLIGPEGNESAVYNELLKQLEVLGFCKGRPCSTARPPLISFPGLSAQGFLSQAFNRFTTSFRGSLKPFFVFIARTKMRGSDKAVIKVINPYTGDRIKIGDLVLETLWPDKKWVMEKLASNILTNENSKPIGSAVLGVQTANLKLNQFSLVFLLRYQNLKAILMGDADEKVQNDIVLSNNLMPLDILKFPHHGSKTGMKEIFLETIKPKEAVISVGKNSYGHPTAEALEMLKNAGVKIRRTDLEGEIKYTF